MLFESIVGQALLDWLVNGLTHASWWQVLLFTLLTAHVTICSVTIFLHRHQSHRALDLHPIASHFFRFWLWISTGLITKEFVAIHRKHHAKCETVDDPHSPQTRGLKALLLTGTELYRAESLNAETIQKFGHGTPDDWIEHNVYSRFMWQGVGLMMVLDIALFGAIGLTVWAVQMAWIPVMATGIINGIGHYWGYRNFESPDASTNVSIWGVLIGGEELHNNHHTYPTSAKFSVKPYEFDVGWLYISLMQRVGLAAVRKVPPKLRLGEIKPVPDEKTLEALIANRYEMMAHYARQVRRACTDEIATLRARHGDVSKLRVAKHWLPRDEAKIPVNALRDVAHARQAHPTLDTWITMREELRQIWTCTATSRDELVVRLRAWCALAESSGISALRDFSQRLRMAHT